jgi:GDP-4-dehydro-6-deoxy-D-mannose reductase
VSGILVTGANGFAGSHLVKFLSESGAQVTGWTRSQVDLLDRKAVSDAIARLRPAVVYHCAGAAHVGQAFSNATETLAANVLGTHHLLDSLRAAGITARVLIPGSSLVYRQSDSPLTEDHPTGPATPYGLSKLAQEMLGQRAIREDGQMVFLPRAFNHIGPQQGASYAAPAFARQIALIEKSRMTPEIAVGNLDTVRDLHDVRDTVRAYAAIIERGEAGRIYNVCAGQGFRTGDVLDRLIAMSRARVTIRIDPARFRPHDNAILLGDHGRIERELGWKPLIPLQQTLSDLLDYWRKQVE